MPNKATTALAVAGRRRRGEAGELGIGLGIAKGLADVLLPEKFAGVGVEAEEDPLGTIGAGHEDALADDDRRAFTGEDERASPADESSRGPVKIGGKTLGIIDRHDAEAVRAAEAGPVRMPQVDAAPRSSRTAARSAAAKSNR